MNKAKIKNVIFLNQMAGPLFRELCEDFANSTEFECILYTGHPDTLKLRNDLGLLTIIESPGYNRTNYLTRVLSWITYTMKSFILCLSYRKSSYFVLVSNPPILGLVAWLINKLFRLDYCVLVYDIHPDAMIRMGPLSENGVIARAWRYINRVVWEQSSLVVTIGEFMAEKIEAQFSSSKTRAREVKVIPPWVDINKIYPIDSRFNPLYKKFKVLGRKVVLYSGNMGISHDIDSILEAAYSLRGREDILFLLIGEGAKWNDAHAFQSKHGLENLQVHKYLPEKELIYSLNLADVSLVALDVGAEGLMVPSKMYYYMGAGSSIMGICRPNNELYSTVIKGELGDVVAPKSPKLLAEKIEYIIDNEYLLRKFKFNSRALCLRKYSRDVCSKKFVNLIKETVS